MQLDRANLLTLILLAAVPAAAPAHDGDPKLLDRRPAYAGRGWTNSEKREALATLPPSPAAPSTTTTAALTGPAVSFPHSNVSLLAWLSLPDFGVGTGGNGNSCFGYTSPSGREYAIMGLSNGTAFVEVTHPGAPVIVAQIPGNTSLWRDMRVFGRYVYSVTENNGGIQVIDVQNIDAGVVTLVNTVSTGGSGNTHTLALNVDSGYLYRAGGSGNGLRIYDLNANPANPTFVGAWLDRYVHEAQVVTYPTGGPGGGPRELAICCGGLNGGYLDTGIDIVDVTNHANPVSLLHVTYGTPGYSHQAWLSPDRQFLYHNDETDGRPFTRVFDASHLNDPTPVLTSIGEFQNGTTVDHNIYTKGSLIYESNYRGGLRVFDRSSGSVTPTLVGYYDTWPEDDNAGYNGLWNNYPYFQSGIVLGSDIEKGLFVWWVGTPQVSFSFPNGQPTTLNPAGQAVLVQIDETTPGAFVAGSAKLVYDLGAGPVVTNLVALGGNRHAAVFPAVSCTTIVRWYLAGESANGVVWTLPESAPAGRFETPAAFAATTLVADGYESSSGWTATVAGDTASQGRWLRADPVGTSAQPEDDHTPGSGAACYVTGNGTVGGSVSGADVDGGLTTLLSPTYALANATTPVVRYWRWYSNDLGAAPHTDALRVDVSNDNGGSWTNVEIVGPTGTETSGGWYQHAFRVADFVTPTALVRVRFQASDLGTDSVVEAAIDDFEIVDYACSGARSFCAGDGSATACPCGNVGASGRGCAHSLGAGALLAASGAPSVANDTLVLQAANLPRGTSVLFFQGSGTQGGGLGAVFGDGLRCAAGTVVRLAARTADVAGVVSWPAAGDPSVSVTGLVTSGAARAYQCWYRNSATFCTSATFNLTNGLSVVWQ